MFERFKEKARKRSAANIAALVSELIDVSNRAEENIRRSGTTNPADIRSVRSLQDDLLIQLCGPLPLEDVKEKIIDPALAGPNVSEGAIMSVNHVYQTAMSGFRESERGSIGVD